MRGIAIMAGYGSNEWIVSLWLNNDQGLQEWANNAMKSLEAEPGDWRALGEHLSTEFDDMFVEDMPDGLLKGIIRDMLTHTDWSEIAEGTWVDE